jgi:hypothetical protein
MTAGPLSDFIHAHAGRAAIVIGGGESAPETFRMAPADAVAFSANRHGCLLRPCDYIVACDEWGTKRKAKMADGVERSIREWGAPVVSVRRVDADIRIFERPIASSGATGAWVAWVMGCAPILLCGMDCYIGKAYFHDAKAQTTGRHVPESSHVARWSALPKFAPDGMFRVLGNGPLTRLFPVYDPAEPVRPPARPESVHGAMGETVRLKRPLKLVGQTVPDGVDVVLSTSEARRARAEGSLDRAPKSRRAAA